MRLSCRAPLPASLCAANSRTACRFARVSSASPPIVSRNANMLSTDQAQLDLAAGPRGVLDGAAFRKIVRAIGYAIESNCAPL